MRSEAVSLQPCEASLNARSLRPRDALLAPCALLSIFRCAEGLRGRQQGLSFARRADARLVGSERGGRRRVCSGRTRTLRLVPSSGSVHAVRSCYRGSSGRGAATDCKARACALPWKKRSHVCEARRPLPPRSTRVRRGLGTSFCSPVPPSAGLSQRRPIATPRRRGANRR